MTLRCMKYRKIKRALLLRTHLTGLILPPPLTARAVLPLISISF